MNKRIAASQVGAKSVLPERPRRYQVNTNSSLENAVCEWELFLDSHVGAGV
jgi:hypothetical protein